MSNSWFRFKEFTIHQDRCAMKVSTDACIQGAWTPVETGVQYVLDIGCGTGLLSLMLAQRNDEINIDAIELDGDSAKQACENIQASPWSKRINMIHGDVKTHHFDRQYDMVICNPPFFNNSLLGDDVSRNNVRHTLSLSYADLFAVLQKVLTPGGYASVLLPAAEHELWSQIVQAAGWGFTYCLHVYPKPGSAYNRVVSVCRKGRDETRVLALQIYETGGGYTQAFTDLLRPFYLKL